MKKTAVTLWGRMVGPLLGALLCLAACPWAFGYVMPAEQVLGFVVQNAVRGEAPVLEQSVSNETEGAEEFLYIEKIRLGEPERYGSERGHAVTEPDPWDTRYRALFQFGSVGRITALLWEMGIDVSAVALDRWKGTAAYRIGDRHLGASRLYIEKRRWVPLFLLYRVATEGGPSEMRVEFKDYRQVGKGWYPYEISCTRQGAERRIYRILDARTSGLFRAAPLNPANEEARGGIPHPSHRAPWGR